MNPRPTLNFDLVVASDFHGTLVDSLPVLRAEAIKIVGRHLGQELTSEQIKGKMTSFVEGSFKGALLNVFPGSSLEQINSCYPEFERRLDEIWPNFKLFPGTRNAILKLTDERSAGLRIAFFISSDAPGKPIKAWVRRRKIKRRVQDVFGSEDGPKTEHMKKIREQYGCMIIYVGDSPEEMSLGDCRNIGIAPPGQEKQYYDAGAVRTVHSFPEILNLKLEEI